MNYDELLTRLSIVEGRAAEEVPEGWQTAEQWARAWGKSTVQASRVLRAACEGGLCERQPFRVRSGARIYPVPHYRLRE